MSGWIKLYRQLQSHWLWTEKRRFSKAEAWIDLLLRANHRLNFIVVEGRTIPVKRGQLITSEVSLATDWNWNRTTVRRFLKLLQDHEMMLKEPNSKWTTITIINYDQYQGELSEPNEYTAQPPMNKDSPESWYTGDYPTKYTAEYTQTRKPKEYKKVIPKNSSSFTLNDFLAAYPRYTPEQLQIIQNYFIALSQTRKSKKISPSIIQAELEFWERFPANGVIQALNIHITKHRDKRENYTRGIIRGINQNGGKTHVGNSQKEPSTSDDSTSSHKTFSKYDRVVRC